ncbi:Endolytic peptidoglycan transglycosylase RlpA [compost metagenome]
MGAFANPDAAELLKAKLSGTVSAPVFISSVVRNQQILHRVRLGPIGTQGEAQQLQDSVRLANLGQPTLVKPD